ncbi:MAG: thioredoxin domain-containing protein [Salinibacterium sp.]|nr:thioredoxin domain-containing protein [Salinibacterium sp.]
MPNRLADAASPYLRSHASNPVDWWQWGPEAFAEAVARDVPVLVSIGYSTCHWCHVMARESFSDLGLAAYLNENFVAIKVDREEHAEVDSTYLAAAAAFTGNLGWPLNVFVTPQGRAFFAGTYWPPEPVAGHPAFRQVLDAVVDAWRNRRDEVERNGAAIVDALAQQHPVDSALPIDFEPVLGELEALEDATYGGFGGAPKFPVSPVLRFLVERRAPLGSRTLDAMAASPLRDPIDGGFFRYSTQRDWHEPHYERMLYDNAQLVAAYALAGNSEVAEGVAQWLETMQLPSGGFASAQDSESTVDGRRVEGFYYSLDAASRKLVDKPPVDEKILTGWNGLAIEGLSLAGMLLDRPDWIATAQRAADFLLEFHARERLIRASIGGVVSTAHATLEDFGMLACGLLQLAAATGEVRYAMAARAFVDASLAQEGEPFGVPGGADPVLASQGLAVEADPSDGAHPSGLSAMAAAAHSLFLVTAHEPYRVAARAAMARVAEAALRHPVSLGAALTVMARLASPVRQIVVVGGGELATVARQHGGIAVSVEQGTAWAQAGFELFEGRTQRAGATTAYVCEDFVCRLPVTTVSELAALLPTR